MILAVVVGCVFVLIGLARIRAAWRVRDSPSPTEDQGPRRLVEIGFGALAVFLGGLGVVLGNIDLIAHARH